MLPSCLNTKCNELILNIERGYKVIGGLDEKRPAFILVGDSKVGKTTLSACLSGIQLKEVKSKGEYTIELENPESNQEIKISHSKKSETKIPVKLLCQEDSHAVFDNPGFFDSDVSDELSNAYFIKRILDTRQQVHILFVIADHYFRGQGRQFRDSIEHLCRLLPKVEELKGYITLVVTQGDRSKEDIVEELDEFVKCHDDLENKIKTMIAILRESIILFPKPPFPRGSMNPLNRDENPILKALIENRKFFDPKKILVRIAISPKCEELVNVLFENRIQSLVESLTKIATRIDNLCQTMTLEQKQDARQTSTGNKPSFIVRTYKIVSNFFKSSIPDSPQVSKLFKLENFLILHNFLSIIQNRDLSVQEFIEKFEGKIDHIFDVLVKFSNGDENELEILCQETKEKVKQVEFLDAVCQKTAFNELEKFRKTFEKTNLKLDEAKKQGLKSFRVSPDEQDRNYYDCALKILSDLEKEYKAEEQNIIIQKAFCFYRIAKIECSNNLFDDALHNCIKSHRLNPSLDNFNLIDHICFGKPTYLDTIAKEKGIIKALYDINTSKFETFLNNMVKTNNLRDKKSLYPYITINQNKVDHLFSIYEILINQRNIINIVNNYNDWDKLGTNIVNIMWEYTTEDEIKKHEGFYAYALKIFSKVEAKDEMTQEIKKCVKILESINIESELYTKVKKFDVVKLSKETDDLQQFENLIEFTKIKDISLNKINLNDDEDVKTLRIKAYFYYANIFLEKKQYENALVNYLFALEDPKREMPECHRKLDELYLKWTNFDLKRIPTSVQEKILQHNISKLHNFLKLKLNIFLDVFKNNQGTYFEKFYDSGDITYLENLKKVFDIIKKIIDTQNYEHLREIFEILKKSMTSVSLESYFNDLSFLENEKKFGIEGFISQFVYIKKLSPASAWKCFRENENSPPFLGDFQANRLFLIKKIEEFQLKENLQDGNYYRQFINFLGNDFTNEMKIMNLASLAFAELGNLEKNLSFYESAINKDSICRKLSRNNQENKKFYAKNSKINIIYEEMAKIYEERDKISEESDITVTDTHNKAAKKKALEYYERCNNFTKIDQIIKDSIKAGQSELEDYILYGDYYKEVGLVNSAIKNYQRANSLVRDLKKKGEINGKISEALSSVGEDGTKTKEFSQLKELLEAEEDFILEEKIYVFATEN